MIESEKRSIVVAIDRRDCPICDGVSRTVGRMRTLDPHSDDLYALQECDRCGHWWTNPMPTQESLARLYQTRSPMVIPDGWVEEASSEPTQAESAVLAGERSTAGGTYLEIGVGKGLLFRRFLEKGFRCFGVEPGSWGKELGNVVDDVSELPDGLIFDVIVANDVLEHLENPQSLLVDLRRRAHPGTRLYCRFPNKDSLRARIRKTKWQMIRPLGHLHYFSRRSLDAAFGQTGWQLTRRSKSEIVQFRFPPPVWRPPILAMMAIDVLGLGDQWLIEAKPGLRA